MSGKKFVEDFTVVNNIYLNDRHFILELSAPRNLPPILPGQFAEILVENSPTTLLRRPFSIYSVDEAKNTLRFLVQIRGEGTRKLGKLRKNDTLNLIYPLGNSFCIPKDDRILLIGGGVGSVPLMIFSQHLNNSGFYPDILLGARTIGDLFEINLFRQQSKNLFITTEDGSGGEQGFVTHHSVLRKKPVPWSRIYCCGPDPMMHAVSILAKELGVECQASLENTMACGFGVCLCCITPTIHGNQRVCVEGPVFDTKTLKWS